MRRWDLGSLAPSSEKQTAREPGADAPRVTRAGRQMPRVLFSSPECRAVVIDLERGDELGEHQVRERAVVEVVSGRVSIEYAAESVQCEAGTLVTFDPGERHTIRALAEARLLLLLAPWPGESDPVPANGSDRLPANAVSGPIAPAAPSPDLGPTLHSPSVSSSGEDPAAREDPLPRRLLVVISAEVADDVLRELIHSRAGEDAEMLVVAPASGISRLDWLTNAEDDARSEASSLAAKTAELTTTEEVEARLGDSDPMRAIEDALRTFPADEILVVTLPDDQAGWLQGESGAKLRERFKLPITRVTVAEDGSLATIENHLAPLADQLRAEAPR